MVSGRCRWKGRVMRTLKVGFGSMRRARRRARRRMDLIVCALAVLTFLAAMSSLPTGDLAAYAWSRGQLEGEQPLVGPTNLRDISGTGPDTAWTVGDGGFIFHTRDGGATWTPQDSGTQEDLLCVSVVDASTAWAAGRRGIVLFTSDGGNTWQALDPGLGRDIYDISACGTDQAGNPCAWAVAEGPVVLRTTDGGLGWDHRDPGNQSRLTSIRASGPDTAVAGGENGTVLYTSDGGNTWSLRVTDTGDNLVDMCAAGTPSTLWAVGETGTAITSGDGGLTWTAHNLETTTTLSAVCAVNASTAWLAGGGGLLHKTTDGCATWGSQDVGNSNNILAIYADGNDDAWVVGENGMVIRTYDGGTTWIPQYVGDGRSLSDVCAVDRDTAWVAGETGAALRTTDGGFTWSGVYPGTTGNLYGVASPGPADAWLVGQNGLVLRTWDSGKSWEEQPSRASYDLHDISCVDGKIAWAVGRRGTIVRTFDEGYTWYRQDPKDTEESALDLLGVFAASATTAYAVGRGGIIIKTGDAGETWTVQESGTTSDLFAVCGSDEENLWACGQKGTLLRTSDGGRTWFPLDAGTAVDLTAVSALRGSGDAAAADASQTAWIAGQDGFAARTRDGGRTWTVQDTGTANALKGVAAPDADTAYVVGARGTILNYRTSPRLDAVSPTTAQAKGTITITGLAFGTGTTDSFVSFGGVKAAQYAQWSERQIKVVMPPGASPREEISVTTPLGTSAGRLLIILPKLDGVSPYYCRPGKPLTIAGASFGPSQGDSYVTIGGVKVTEFEYWTNNVIRLTVPGNAPESAEVKVVTASGASNPIKVTVSRTPPTIAEIIKPKLDFLDPTTAVTGQEVVIYGSGFGPGRGASYVSFGAVKAAEYTAWANDRIGVKVPAGVVGQVKVTVTTAAGTTGALAFTAVMPPTISDITPPSGTAGSQVEIRGAAFGPREGPTNYVSFNGARPQVYDYWSEGRIVVKVPAQLDGRVTVTVTTPTAISNTVYFMVKKADLRGVDAGGGRAWAVGESGTIMRSTDGGATWRHQDSGCNLWLYGVSAGSAARVWAVGEGGVIITTSDGGSTWTRHPTGATRTLYGVDAVAATTAWAVGDGGVVLKTVDSGSTWTPQASGTGSTLYAVSAVDANTAWAVGAGGVVLKTVDGGSSWSPQNSRVTATLYGVSAVSADTCWSVGSAGTILRTENGGLTWVLKGTSGTIGGAAAGEADTAGSETGAAVGAGGSAPAEGDRGTATDDTASANPGREDGIARETGTQAAGGNDAGTPAATDTGAGTAAIPVPVTTATLRAVCAASPFIAWVVGEGGVVYKTSDGGLTWNPCGGSSSSLYGVASLGATALTVGNGGTTRLLP
jgi:photosystem II stability/assembly factor-like uncharacterized protein